jgi:hypothetical protein
MPRVEFEPTIPASERAKTVHALDSAATVIGSLRNVYMLEYINLRDEIYSAVTRVVMRIWLRHYATSPKVACSIPDDATGFLTLPNSSSCSMALSLQ